MALTAKQEQFCKEYLIDLNATQAAIRAGYSADTANEQGSQNLVKLSISERIAELQAERARRCEITADDVLKEFWSIAKDDIKNYLSFRTITLTNVNPITEIPEEFSKIDIAIKDSQDIETKNISEVSIGKDGQFKFKLYCRDNALLQVGRHLGMFEKDQPKPPQNININSLPIEDIETLIAIKKKANG